MGWAFWHLQRGRFSDYADDDAPENRHLGEVAAPISDRPGPARQMRGVWPMPPSR